MANQWQIIDDKGVIHSGTEEEMDSAWDVLTFTGSAEMFVVKQIELCQEDHIDNYAGFYEQYNKWWVPGWTGDVKLIEVHKTYR